MYEYILATIFGRNKTKTFSGIKPLDRTCTQNKLPLLKQQKQTKDDLVDHPLD